MTLNTSVSLLAQNIAQSSRLLGLGASLTDLQRQVTTGKKYDDYSGFGTSAYKLQTMKIESTKLTSYAENTSTVATNMEQMTSILEKISGVGTKFKSALILREDGESSAEALAETASAYLDFVQDLLNQVGVDGSYLFSGSNTSDATFIDNNGLNSNFNNLMDEWINGTITTAQMQTQISALNTAELGLDPSLDSASTRKVVVSDTTTIDYVIKGDMQGVKDLLKALTLVANVEYPDITSVPTTADLETLYSFAENLTSSSIEDVNTQTSRLATRYNTVKVVADRHKADLAIYNGQIDELENADTTEALIKMNLLETQIEAAYQVTSSISQLSLVNYIN